MLSGRKVIAVWLFLVFERVLAAQAPLLSHTSSSFRPAGVEDDLGQWDLHKAPVMNATGHLVFETANSLLQHWANTRYRIGHTIVPGTVPVGTLLYHGAPSPRIPTALDWVAVEPDHSIMFSKGPIETGCWHLTLAVTRSMKVLYFDGSSAANLLEGTMDTQDLVAWSKMKPEWVWNEKQRIKDLCKWGQKYGLNGFVRMEMNFEIMICDFTSHMEVVSFLNLESTHIGSGPPTNMPEDPTTVYQAFELMHATSWRENYPGETRIILDFSGLVSFYDTSLVPSLVPRRVGLERWDHRVGGISSEDIEHVRDRLDQVLTRSPVTTSGIDWKTVLRVVVDRYASRLDFMQHLLNMTLDDRSIFDHAQQIQRRLRTVLLPYTVFSALPPNTSVTANTTNVWAAPVFRECATSHTASIVARGTTLMPSERLLLQAVQETTHEICRIATKMWASGIIIGVDPLHPPEQRPEADHIHTLMGEWKEDLRRLISWLDWSVWAKCRPACGFEEMCYLLTWPFGFFPAPGEPYRTQWDSASLWPDPNKGEWKRPQPKCIRRREPYNF
ncbi:uncharacterized protein F5891DRAFT_1185661 [Suillus fuscotomentosus]|uniref:Uncharacterized protein n=1 Tax=Suillus fuscotomentosus TaxID=1912939 RepID=A0AAD4HNI4_9AGAM|nr:uncharacterized protein F5891DRAFT_1185661 [Suillus fuscotomentosus]KAG1903012.1 hypothetical protein F5891DRAFT_1185661 [Suillus fuscotomentosus]